MVVIVDNDKPFISVLIPSLNSQDYIKQCVESVIGQTLEDIEILCIDAGSDDKTLEILNQLAAEDSRITIFNSDKRSYGYQMNIGLDNSNGEYIAIVESDDFIEKNMLADLYDSYGSQLLEGNVRSFLSTKVAVNKKIRETILRIPQNFFAYNNGVSATVMDLKVEKGEEGRYITYAKDFQIINAWRDMGYKEETILLALKEASYNEVYNIPYIDKILNNWDKKGIKTEADVNKYHEEFSRKKEEPIDILAEDYDWLNE